MKRNTDKCHLDMTSNDSSEVKIRNSMIKRRNSGKLLDVTSIPKSLLMIIAKTCAEAQITRWVN